MDLDLSLVVSQSAAHIHQGPVGGTGSVVFTLPQGSFSGHVVGTLSPSQAEALLNGDMYINVHTDANPSGELRSQVIRLQGSFLDRESPSSRFHSSCGYLFAA